MFTAGFSVDCDCGTVVVTSSTVVVELQNVSLILGLCWSVLVFNLSFPLEFKFILFDSLWSTLRFVTVQY